MYSFKSTAFTTLLLCTFTVSWSASIGGHHHSARLQQPPSAQDQSIERTNSHLSASSSIDLAKVVETNAIQSPLSPTLLSVGTSPHLSRPLTTPGLRLKRALRSPKKGYNDQPGSNIAFDDTKNGDDAEDGSSNDLLQQNYDEDDQVLDLETDHTPEQDRAVVAIAVNPFRKQGMQLMLPSSRKYPAESPMGPSSNFVHNGRVYPFNTNKAGEYSSAEPTYFRTASKRSPMCLRKCMAQGFLHPAQCHSLC